MNDAIDMFHPRLQQVVDDVGWRDLYPIQKSAIRVFFESTDDVIVSAPTSGGKTEAVFLPIISELCE